jgi:uncharacterized integral membrane protein
MRIDARKGISYRRFEFLDSADMNAKLLLKTCFMILILLLLVMMGMNNRGNVSFALPPLIPKSVSWPAAMMYFAFFAVGVLTGTVLTAGGKKGSSSSSSKSSK